MSQLVTIPHPSLRIEAYRCGPDDEEPLLDRLETLLHADYYFRRGHFQAILRRPQAAVVAILVEDEFAAIAILYNRSTLQNLYVHPEHKRQGVGRAVLDFFKPKTIRAKTNMSQGDPTEFYEKAGYSTVATDPNRPHIALMTQNGTPPPAPAATAKKEISPARRAQLDAARAKQAEKRAAKKEAAAIAATQQHAPAAEVLPCVETGRQTDAPPPVQSAAFAWPWPD